LREEVGVILTGVDILGIGDSMLPFLRSTDDVLGKTREKFYLFLSLSDCIFLVKDDVTNYTLGKMNSKLITFFKEDYISGSNYAL
jgi:hypothetical protein